MNIMELGALGEFIGSMAVLVTLLILVFQIRGARAEFSSQIVREIKRHNNQDIQLPLQDPRTLDIHLKAQRDFSSLEDAEKIYWGVWLYSWMTQAEDAWLIKQRGIDDMGLTDTFVDAVATVLRSNGGQVMWPRIRSWFDSEFAAYVDKAIEKSDVTWLEVMLDGQGSV